VTYNTAEDGTFVVIDGACEKGEESDDPWLQVIECASGEVKVDPITPGKLGVSENGITLGNDKAGGTGTVTVTFTLDNPLPANGAIAVTFPKGFVLNSEENPTKAIFIDPEEGTFSVIEIKHEDGEKTTAVFSRSGDELEEGHVVEVKLTNIRNPQVSGQTQNFEIRTSVGK
jgi:hypothetical protein